MIATKHASKQRSVIISRKKFYGASDEYFFFYYVKQIPSIINFDIFNKEIVLHFQKKALSLMDIEDVRGLFERYRIDMQMIRQFLTKRNQKWIIKYTRYKSLFGKQS